MTTGDSTSSACSTGEARAGWLAQSRLVPLVVASALFMDLMDSSALAMALPTIARHFAVPVVDLKLALTAYVVTVAVLVPTSGWLASRFGARRIFLMAMALFMLGSVCCGMSETVPQLVLARILQGVGGSMMTPVGRTIMVASVPRQDLVRGMAWYTMPAILAPLMGPPVAGALIQFADWRWIFFINVPVGLLGMIAVLRLVPALAATRRPRFDFIGFLLAGASILAIMALVETSALAGQPASLRLAGIAAALLLTVIYVRQALRTDDPIADFRVLRHGSFRWSLVATWLHRTAMGGILVLLPLQLQIGLGHGPLVSSQVMVCAAVGSVLSRFVCPKVIRLLGFRRMMLLFGALTACLSLIPTGFGLATPLILMGGIMMAHATIRAAFFMAGNTLVYCDVEGEEIGHASVLFAMSQQLSLGLGYSLATTILEAAGGPHVLSAFTWAYIGMVLVQVAGTLAIAPLSARAGENMRRSASA